ncbi:MAG: cysteine desulfurase [Acidobacteriia bacterium]|nr:cysteine desulfurase [Terriglobia bacterium]
MAAVRRIYLDHHATTPLLPEVRAAMEPYLGDRFGNPSAASVYPEGRQAHEAVEAARAKVAALLGARPSEIVFTSGATESDNWALKGAAWARQPGKDHLITCAIEHQAVLEPAAWLGRREIRVTTLGVDSDGRVDPDSVRRAIGPGTFLVSIQMANGEIGTVEPVEAIGEICRERGVLFHVDAAQAVGKIRVAVGSIGADLLSLSAHKIYGPKGTGALFVRRRVRIEPLLHGGGQERGRRSGTVHVAGVVGMGAACEAAARDLDGLASRLAALRDRLWEGISCRISSVRRNGDPVHALPHNLSVTFEGVYAQALVQALRSVSASSGSACSSSNPEPSHVLRAIGLPDALADASLRFGLGRDNTADDIDEVAESLSRAVDRLRSLSPV